MKVVPGGTTFFCWGFNFFEIIFFEIIFFDFFSEGRSDNEKWESKGILINVK